MIRITPVKIAKIDLLGIYVLQYSAEFGGPSFFHLLKKKLRTLRFKFCIIRRNFVVAFPYIAIHARPYMIRISNLGPDMAIDFILHVKDVLHNRHNTKITRYIEKNN